MGHYQPVFRNCARAVGVRMARRPHHAVAISVDRATTLGLLARLSCKWVTVLVVARCMSDAITVTLCRLIATSESANRILASRFLKGVVILAQPLVMKRAEALCFMRPRTAINVACVRKANNGWITMTAQPGIVHFAIPFSRIYRFMPKHRTHLVPASPRAVSLEPRDPSQRSPLHRRFDCPANCRPVLLD